MVVLRRQPDSCRALFYGVRAVAYLKLEYDLMAREPMLITKTLKAPSSVEEVVEVHSQSKRPIAERFHLQVDRQTKKSYSTAVAATDAAMLLKRSYPLLQVVVYDSVEVSRTAVELKT